MPPGVAGTRAPHRRAAPTPEPLYLAAGLAIAVVLTVGLRATGFFAKRAVSSSTLQTIYERWMPMGVVTILAVYCLTGIDVSSVAASVPEVAGVLVTVGLHLWRGSMLLSMGGGAATCIVLAAWVMPGLA